MTNQKDTVEMPEEIWVDKGRSGLVVLSPSDATMGMMKYVRADTHQSAKEPVEKMREALYSCLTILEYGSNPILTDMVVKQAKDVFGGLE